MLDARVEEDRAKRAPEPDQVSKAIGEYGRWQLLITFLLSLFNIPCTWHIFAPTFQAAPSDYYCAPPAHLAAVDPERWKDYSQPASGACFILDLPWSNVTASDVVSGPVPNASSVPCTAWIWSGDGGRTTTVSEWQLVCDRSEWNNISEMVFLAGVAIGGLIGGVVSDRYGRKTTLMTALSLQILIGTVIAFAPWFWAYLALRSALGFVSVCVVFSAFVLSLEVVGDSWRTIAGVCYLLPVSLSYGTIAGMAWLIPRWRDLQLAVSLPAVLLLMLYPVLPESPRWLLALGRLDETDAILRRAAAANGRPEPRPVQAPTGHDNKDAQSHGVLDLFRTPRLRHDTLCLFVIWFAVYLVYYGLVLNMGQMGGNLYLNSVLSGLVEIPALVASIVLLLKCGRRWPLCLTLVISGIACLMTLAFPPTFSPAPWLSTALAMLGKLSVSSSNAIMPVFTAELYPTVIRNLGVGASNVSAGVALMLVPYLWMLTAMHPTVPMSVLGGFGIVGGLCVLLLPETANRPLESEL